MISLTSLGFPKSEKMHLHYKMEKELMFFSISATATGPSDSEEKTGNVPVSKSAS